jgi:hypothetical protein
MPATRAEGLESRVQLVDAEKNLMATWLDVRQVRF